MVKKICRNVQIGEVRISDISSGLSCRKPLSVVIATLGGGALIPTIERLNQGSVKPDEILVCVPELEAATLTRFSYSNVRIIVSPNRGQVAQRALGFQCARNEYVLQLDDDMSVGEYCLERLLEASQVLGPFAAVSPALIDAQTGHSVYKKPQRPKFLLSIYYWLMNGSSGYQPGRIDKAGSAVGVDPVTAGPRFTEVEWLPGGCILHRGDNLVLEDFWTRPGKAYCEDIVHSFLLNQRGISLFVDTSALCELEVARQNTFNFRIFMTDLYRDFCARRYYMKRFGRSSGRMYFLYFVRLASYVLSRLR